MNEIIKELKTLTSDIGCETIKFMRTLTFEDDREKALVEYSLTRKRYKKITFVIIVICIMITCLCFFVL